ncbi:hypothetical protein AC249_AIPGENE28907 [Exaiptasia diaphana]|nr:hypothetical protein AC249_AIPGENE28907 [Exaiptasia diaphana]
MGKRVATIILVLRRHKLDIAKQHQSVNGQEEQVKYLKERKTTITAAYIFGAFLLVNIPIIADYLYTLFFAHGNEIRTPLYFLFHPWVDVSLHLNSILCPIIYGLRTKEFRKQFLRYFLGINHQVDVFVSYERRKDTGPPKEGVRMAQSDSCDSPEGRSKSSNEKSKNLCVEK